MGVIIRKMRIKVRLNAEKPIILPVHYNYIIQGFIYHHLDPVIRNILHERGVPYRKRQYKLFTFSQIFPAKITGEENNWIMQPPLDFYISAYDEKILENFALHLVRKKVVQMGTNTLTVESISAIIPPDYRENLFIKTLSPITIHSTEIKNGKRHTRYYSPHELEFPEKLRENLRRKFVAIHGVYPEEKEDFLKIEPVEVPQRPAVIRYKGFVIVGWKGLYKLTTSPAYFKLSYTTGLGSRNSIGFGMWKPVTKYPASG